MNREKIRALFRGLPVPLFVGVSFLLGVGAVLVHVPEPVVRAPVAGNSGGVSVVRLDASNADLVLRQEAILRDPKPLFLPTSWNTAYAVQADRMVVTPGASFEAYAFKPLFSGAQGPVELPALVRLPESAAKAFDPLRSDKPYIGLAARAEAPAALAPRRACIELREAGTGRVVVCLDINDLKEAQGVLWSPAEFLACVSASGLVGRPSLVFGSGVESVDGALEGALVRHWPALEKLGKLQPGLYRVTLGP